MQNISRITRSQAIFMQQFFLIKINTFLLNKNSSTYKNAITFFYLLLLHCRQLYIQVVLCQFKNEKRSWKKKQICLHSCIEIVLFLYYTLNNNFFLPLPEPHRDDRWCNGQHACLECSRLWVRALIVVKPDYKIGTCICCFSAKHAALRRKSKDGLAQNQPNVSQWGNTSIRELLHQ